MNALNLHKALMAHSPNPTSSKATLDLIESQWKITSSFQVTSPVIEATILASVIYRHTTIRQILIPSAEVRSQFMATVQHAQQLAAVLLSVPDNDKRLLSELNHLIGF